MAKMVRCQDDRPAPGTRPAPDALTAQRYNTAALVLRQLSNIRMPQKVWLTPREAAAYLSLADAHLQKLRKKGGGPAFASHGPRIVRYHVDALDAWLRAGEEA